jgi:hypothetical protein
MERRAEHAREKKNQNGVPHKNKSIIAFCANMCTLYICWLACPCFLQTCGPVQENENDTPFTQARLPQQQLYSKRPSDASAITGGFSIGTIVARNYSLMILAYLVGGIKFCVIIIECT